MQDRQPDEFENHSFFFLKDGELAALWHGSDVGFPKPEEEGHYLTMCGLVLARPIIEFSTLRMSISGARHCERCLGLLAAAADVILTQPMRDHLGIRTGAPLPRFR